MCCHNSTELEPGVWSSCQGKPLRGESPGLNYFTFSGFRGLALLNSGFTLKAYVSIQVSTRPLPTQTFCRSLSKALILQVGFRTWVYHSIIEKERWAIRKTAVMVTFRWCESTRLWSVEWPLSSLVESHTLWVSVDLSIDGCRPCLWRTVDGWLSLPEAI